MKKTVLLCVLALSGCATIESGADRARDFAVAHPVAAAVAVGLTAGAIAVSVNRSSGDPAKGRLADQGICGRRCGS